MPHPPPDPSASLRTGSPLKGEGQGGGGVKRTKRMKEKETMEIKSSYLEGERVTNFKTLSGMEYKEVYTPDDATGAHELPGAYPFTRGIHRTMYRSRLWTR